MPLSWNEIKHRAINFAKEWQDEQREEAEAKSFWDAFFDVFGVSRKIVASFEAPVKSIKGTYHYIDLFWAGRLIAEHKSAGKNLQKAESQAFRYIQDLVSEGREEETPRYVILSDFARIVLFDLEPDQPPTSGERICAYEFPLIDLHKNIHLFAFIPGYKIHTFANQDPINIRAAEVLGNLYDTLEGLGYPAHSLERFLVRTLFCLFAEDTGIFERESFRLFIENRTAKDGSDLGTQLARLFDVLNTPVEKRQKALDETLAAFPYVNGELFAESLGFADFNRDMRNALLACTLFDWSQISPAIFGSLFQSIMAPKERRQIGAHYTSERDILKLIRALFLDDLLAEFEAIKADRSSRRKFRLEEFHKKLGSLCFLDPACGCGNFLVITYRELRKLEIQLLLLLHRQEIQEVYEVQHLSRIDVDQFYGIEIEEWPARIAEVALWLMDHQMNLQLSEAFGQYFARLPLRKAPTIVVDNALHLDWATIIPSDKCSFILGNPPFVGAKYQTAGQREDMKLVIGNVKSFGLLDYVTGWYFKAAKYIQGTRIKVAFVSTNSVSQGEQVGVLWQGLFKHGISIHFCYRTFPWESEARGRAHVHVVIIGFGAFQAINKRIYEIDTSNSEAARLITTQNISPYLLEGPDSVVVNRQTPLCDVPEMGVGNKPIDDGNYLFTPEEKDEFIKQEPESKAFFRRWIGSEEFINGIERWCLWLGECSSSQLNSMPLALARVKAVRAFRQASKSAPTIKLAQTPARFHVENMPDKSYLVIPRVSSEKRTYIPMGFVPPAVIAGDSCLLIPDAKLYHFGVLTSAMHMAWAKQICGRLKSDFRYSNKLVYNNFPWPSQIPEEKRQKVEELAQQIIDLRIKHGDGRVGFLMSSKLGKRGSSLADLYSPLTMPAELVKAHRVLDRAVDRCYRTKPFANDRERVEYLFALYEQLTLPMLVEKKPTRRKKKSGEQADRES